MTIEKISGCDGRHCDLDRGRLYCEHIHKVSLCPANRRVIFCPNSGPSVRLPLLFMVSSPRSTDHGVATMVPNANATPDLTVPDTPHPCIPSAVLLEEIDVAGVSGRVDGSLVNKVRKLVDDYPDQTLEVIRGWMAEGYRH